MKRCNRCKRELPEERFGMNSSNPDGLQYSCRECLNKVRRKRKEPYRVRTREEVAHDISLGSKVCSKCGERKPFHRFGRHAKGADGHNTTCYDCKARRQRQTVAHKRYGLSREEYNEMKSKGCEVCGSKEKLHIDHNHETGQVRGCLCHYCNTALGLLRESAERIDALRKYILTF